MAVQRHNRQAVGNNITDTHRMSLMTISFTLRQLQKLILTGKREKKILLPLLLLDIHLSHIDKPRVHLGHLDPQDAIL
jgi:hypothetical protein